MKSVSLISLPGNECALTAEYVQANKLDHIYMPCDMYLRSHHSLLGSARRPFANVPC